MAWLRRIFMSSVALIVAVGSSLVLGWNSPSSAADGNILPPFTLGEQWYVWQGYSSGTHTGTSQYGLDLTINTSATATAGKVVRAPMSGTILYWQASYGNLCVNTPNGRSYTMTHINASRTSGAVNAGDVLGSVAAAGAANNNGVAHLHFEFWSGPGCYDKSTPIPLDAAHGTRMCGAPDLTATGPNAGNGTWSRIYFTGQSCSSGSNPQGSLDGSTSPSAGTVDVRGWAFDRDAVTSPINIHMYVGGPAGAAGAEGHDLGPANVSRPDVGAAFPGVGDNHGFDKTVETGKTGSQPVYVYAINVGGGGNVLLGQSTVTIADPNPFGSFDSLTSTPHKQLRVQGWAIDRNVPTSPIGLHAYVGGPAGAANAEFHDLGTAGLSRPDVAAAYPGTGQNHGFDKTFTTAKTGSQTVYLYTINQGPGSNRFLLSRTVDVVVDTDPPDTFIDRVDTDGRTATVHFSSDEAGASFECSSAGSPWAPCSSPAALPLASTVTDVSVRAVDSARNVDETPALATLPAAAATAATPTPSPGRGHLRVKLRVLAHDRLRLNVNPDWQTGNYRVLVQERSAGRWRTTRRTKTRGLRDSLSLNLPRGTYRIVVKRPGFDQWRSSRLRMHR